MRQIALRTTGYRLLAWPLGLVSWVVLPAWACLQFSHLDARPLGMRCGLPNLAVMVITAIYMAIASLLALGISIVALRTKPLVARSPSRFLELAILGLPLVICGGFALAVLSTW